LGGVFTSAILVVANQYLDQITANGTVIVASAGNQHNLPGGSCGTPFGGVVWPATRRDVIAVGGLNQKGDNIDGDSCQGSEIDILASYYTVSLSPHQYGGQTFAFGGTSGAAPVVASAVAVLKNRAKKAKGTLLSGATLRDELLKNHVKALANC